MKEISIISRSLGGLISRLCIESVTIRPQCLHLIKRIFFVGVPINGIDIHNRKYSFLGRQQTENLAKK